MIAGGQLYKHRDARGLPELRLITSVDYYRTTVWLQNFQNDWMRLPYSNSDVREFVANGLWKLVSP